MHKRGSAFFCLILLFASCAHIVAPNGGIKDVTPPKVLQTSPNNYKTNFKSTKIILKFDEYVQLTNPDDQVIISPPLNNKAFYTIKGKQLEIKVNDTLKTNTTYTINFGNALGDNHENNILQNYNYVFCTGDVIDTAFLTGSVHNAFNTKAASGITVALYNSSSYTDSTPYKERPVYLTKTNESGLFKISNLPYKSFNLFAFKDDNKNNKADLLEDVTFLNTTVTPGDTNTKSLDLSLFSPDLYVHGKIIDTFLREPNKLTIVTYKALKTQFKNTNNSSIYIQENTNFQKLDTFNLFTQAGSDSFIYISATINGINHLIKTISKPKLKAQSLLLTSSNQIELDDTIILRFNNPILKFDTSKIKLTQDTTPLLFNYINTNDFTLKITYNWQEKNNYSLNIQDSAFIDLYNQYNTKQKQFYTIKSIKDYASLLLHFKTPSKTTDSYIVQLVDTDDKPTKYQYIINRDTSVNIKYILPGTYKLKIITDTNNNKQWDNGDVFKHILPEQVYYYNELLQLKAFWDLEQRITLE